MNFETAIIWLGKLYRLLEKYNFQKKLDLDNYIDNNYPQVLSRLQTYSKYEKIAICATNGKKTTTDFLNQILNANHHSSITNITKDSKILPALTAIILDLSKGFDVFGSNCSKDYYTIAFNEYELQNYFNSIKFDYLLLHNVFKDQKDFFTIDEKRNQIKSAILLNSKLNLVINADEPMFYKIDEIKNDSIMGKKRNKFYYGFEKIEIFDDGKDIVQQNDIIRCPLCSCKLDYQNRYYSHLGSYNCECGFKRPELDVKGYAKIFNDYSFLTVFYKNNKLIFKLPFGGTYNAYNALGAIAMALCLDIDRKTITNAIENYLPLKARDEILDYRGKKIKLKVIKNATSLSESLCEIYGQKNTKLVFCLSDEKEDGFDTSWIWGANFKALTGFNNKIYISAKRCDDIALRLKYAGLNPCLLTTDHIIKNSIECCFWELEKEENMLILATPSTIDEIYKIIKK